MKKIYLKDIAKDLNVSKTAVSLVLNNKGDENKISKDTQQKILKYAKAHNYIPNQLARSLSMGKTDTIGLIIPNISDTFYSKVAGIIEKKAKEKGYTVLFSSSYEDPKKEGELIRSMLNRQVDGLIIASTQKNQNEIDFLKNENFPFVLFDRHYPENDTDYVIVDNFIGTKTATEHLIKLGRKRIGLITLKPELDAITQRYLGYKKALEETGRSPEQSLVKEIEREEYIDDMKAAINALVMNDNAVDAIIFATHYLASQGLRVLKQMHVNVPKDVAIVSFDELSAFDLVDPPITSVIQPIKDIGASAIEILLERINGDKTNLKQALVLPTKLEVRGSCGEI